MNTAKLLLMGALMLSLSVSLASVACAHSFPENESPAAAQT